MQTMSLILWLAFMICVFLVWFFSHRASHRERMLRIEKGMDDVKEASEKKNLFRFSWFRFACLVTGLSFGLLIISVLVGYGVLNNGGNALPIAILGLSGGISMIVAHCLQKEKQKSR
jgi:hypothetical protein